VSGEAAEFLARGEVEQSGNAVLRAGEQLFSIGREGGYVHIAHVAEKSFQQFARGNVPETGRAGGL
jgi:hypothetical protein